MEHNHDCSHSHEHGHEHEDAHDKYMEALAKYNTHLNDEDVKAKVTHFIEEHLAENNTPEVKKFLFHCIDLTTLKCTDSEESVMKFTEKVNDFVDKYPDLSNVAAICVYPNMAEIVNVFSKDKKPSNLNDYHPNILDSNIEHDDMKDIENSVKSYFLRRKAAK